MVYCFACPFRLSVSFLLLELDDIEDKLLLKLDDIEDELLIELDDDIEDELLLVKTVELVDFELLDSAVLLVLLPLWLIDVKATIPKMITTTIDIAEMITFLLFKIALPFLLKYVITL